MNDVEKYLSAVSEPHKNILLSIRKLIKELAPKAEESISYGVPAFKLNKKPLLYYAAYKNHMSLYPASDGMIEFVGPELAKFRTSKGTLQFTVENQIPVPLLKKVITYRLSEITAK